MSTDTMPMTELLDEARPSLWTVISDGALFVLLILAAIAMNLVAAVGTGFVVAWVY